ncbi:MAG: zinc-binding alcohol dehydrogenase family protein [Bacteroidales bacterium]
MKAVGFKQSLPIEDVNSLVEFEMEIPQPQGRDILVKVAAVSMNPVDLLIRETAAMDEILEVPKIIGWDAVGTVVAIGECVTLFDIGDRVFYAGDITRSGCNAEYQMVDERIVGFAPNSLTDAQAAAMPLTSLTAYESLFDRMRVNREQDRGKSVLILSGAGGVGSIAIQLAKSAELLVIATASRAESADWCKKMGADYVVDHYNLKEELSEIGHSKVDYIMDFVNLEGYWEMMAKIIKPQGHIVSITKSDKPLSLDLLKRKSVTFSWEFMFTRPMFETEDMIRQHTILNIIAEMLDSGTLQSTLTTTIDGLSAQSIKCAHELQKSARTIGKTVILF